MSSHTFLWHDYETFGANTRRDRPAQFAAIRTDADLNEIGDPIMLYCQPAPDFLPDPQSCLITGITPQLCLDKGIPEYQFAAEIEKAFSQSGTIGVGYNTIRFDDEITRFMFWRNLIDPYAREWMNQCGRWDLLDVVRTAYALRPEGINWPMEEGKPSFKLERLSAANGLQHESAHDALSDVRATIALARLIRDTNARLFDFCLALHKKDKAADQVSLASPRPFLHVSGMFPAQQGCMAVMWPLAQHPTNRNEIIAWDLAHDPRALATLTADDIRHRLFTKSADLPEGVTRLPVKSIHLNKSPMVIGQLKTLAPERAAALGIDMALAEQHAALASQLQLPASLWAEVFQTPERPQQDVDVDQDLYGGFIGNNDRRQLTHLRTLTPQALAQLQPHFEDGRLSELLFHYRARNFPETLDQDETAQWEALRAARFYQGQGGAITMDSFFNQIDTLSENASERDEEILGALYDYAEMIAPPHS